QSRRLGIRTSITRRSRARPSRLSDIGPSNIAGKSVTTSRRFKGEDFGDVLGGDPLPDTGSDEQVFDRLAGKSALVMPIFDPRFIQGQLIFLEPWIVISQRLDGAPIALGRT